MRVGILSHRDRYLLCALPERPGRVQSPGLLAHVRAMRLHERQDRRASHHGSLSSLWGCSPAESVLPSLQTFITMINRVLNNLDINGNRLWMTFAPVLVTVSMEVSRARPVTTAGVDC